MSFTSEETSLIEKYAPLCARACIPDAVKNATLCDTGDYACQCRPSNAQAIEAKARECLQNQCEAMLTKVITAARARDCSQVQNGSVPFSSSVSTPQPTGTLSATPASNVATISSTAVAAASPSASSGSESLPASTAVMLAIAFGSIMGFMMLSAAAVGCLFFRRRKRWMRWMENDNQNDVHAKKSHDTELTTTPAVIRSSSSRVALSADPLSRLPSNASILDSGIRPSGHSEAAAGQAVTEHPREVHDRNMRAEMLGDTRMTQEFSGHETRPEMYELPCYGENQGRKR